MKVLCKTVCLAASVILLSSCIGMDGEEPTLPEPEPEDSTDQGKTFHQVSALSFLLPD